MNNSIKTTIVAALTMTIALFSTLALSNDFTGAGARYSAQAGTMVANANDAFALFVNPANIVVQDESLDLANFAGNAQHYPEDQNGKRDFGLHYLGGFKVSNEWLLGGYLLGPTLPVYVPLNDGSFEELSTVIYGVSYAKGGNIFANNSNARWALGASLDLISARTEGGYQPKSDYAGTLSGALLFKRQFNFQTQAINVLSQFGVSHAHDIGAELGNNTEISLRPSITRAGAKVSLIHLNTIVSWQLSIATELYKSSSSNPVPSNVFELGNTPNIPSFAQITQQNINVDEQRIGGELTFIQPFQLDGDFSIRAGVKVSKQSLNIGTSGIGFTYGNWSYDISVSESTFVDGDVNYEFSISYTH